MSTSTHPGARTLGATLFVAAIIGFAGFAAPRAAAAQSADAPAPVTFTKDIAPILQRSCQNCHQPNSVAPMSLITYEDVRPWAPRHQGADPSGAGRRRDAPLVHPKRTSASSTTGSIRHSATRSSRRFAQWVNNGAPRGDPADLPPAKPTGTSVWTAGEPDLITVTEELLVGGDSPDWWGEIELTPIGNTEDRYVASVEIREVNDVLSDDADPNGRQTVGGRFVVHHMVWSTQVLDDDGEILESTFWPVHEVGRNADTFDPEGARLLTANSLLRVGFGAPPLERPRHEGPPRDRMAIPSEGLRAEVQAGAAEPRQRRRHRHQGDGEGPGAPRLLRAPGAHEDHDVRAPPARARGAHVSGSDLGHQRPDAVLLGLRPQLGQGLRVRRPATSRCCRRAPSSTSPATWTTRRATKTCPTRETGRGRGIGRWPTYLSTWAMASP